MIPRFLDQRVFDRILDASAEKYSDQQRQDLQYVQDRTRSEKERYHRGRKCLLSGLYWQSRGWHFTI